MEVSKITNLILFYQLFVFLLAVSQGLRCSNRWFGEKCQYKCYCQNAYRDYKCNVDGSCPKGFKCATGWFGPACQYLDLTNKSDPRVRVVTDGNDNTCLYEGRKSVYLRLDGRYTLDNGSSIFTWLRLHVRDPADLLEIDVDLWRNRDSKLVCQNQRKYTIGNRTLDIYCDLAEPINIIELFGYGIKSLCSVYISGGRNLALKQDTTQSSQFDHEVHPQASYSVDGNTDGDFEHGSCTHSSVDSKRQSWSVDFQKPVFVNTYIIYNRIHSDATITNRLKGFTITSLNENNESVFTYQDKERSSRQRYTILAPASSKTQQISKVEISVTNILTLCEVEVYGECGKGLYGLDCKQMCSTNCAKDGSCLSSNGGCSYGCKAGFSGDLCNTRCGKGQYGLGCKQKCSPNCAIDGSCLPSNGKCTYGCTAGFSGDLCNTKCKKNTYGIDCKLNCSQFCLTDGIKEQSVCHFSSGVCLLGCQQGYTGSKCQPAELNAYSLKWKIGFFMVCALLVIVVAGILLYCRKAVTKPCRKSENKQRYNNMMVYRNEDSTYEEPVQMGIGRYTNTAQDCRQDLHPGIGQEGVYEVPDRSQVNNISRQAGEANCHKVSQIYANNEVGRNTTQNPSTTKDRLNEVQSQKISEANSFLDRGHSNFSIKDGDVEGLSGASNYVNDNYVNATQDWTQDPKNKNEIPEENFYELPDGSGTRHI